MSSGSTLEMAKAQCADVGIDASSGPGASVYADKRIDANASSGASVRVYGAHEEIEIETSSGGGIDFP